VIPRTCEQAAAVAPKSYSGGASARVKATLRRFAALTHAFRSPSDSTYRSAGQELLATHLTNIRNELSRRGR
jgi:hypothetical protein